MRFRFSFGGASRHVGVFHVTAWRVISLIPGYDRVSMIPVSSSVPWYSGSFSLYETLHANTHAQAHVSTKAGVSIQAAKHTVINEAYEHRM